MLPTTKRISHLLASGNKAQVKNYVTMHHPVDVAAAITSLRPEDILTIIEIVGNHRGLEIFEDLEKDTQKACLEYAAPERVINFFSHLSDDEQVDLLKLISPDVRERVLQLLEKSEREDLMRLVRYAEGTAGSKMTTDFFTLHPDSHAGEALNEIKKKYEEAETIYTNYVTDGSGKLLGVVSLKDLVLAGSDKTLREIMNPNVISVTTDEDVESVAKKISKYDLFAVPVVNHMKELRGIITVDDVIDIIEQETTEDIYALGAVGAPIDYLSSSVLNIARQRITWLLALVCSGFLAGYILKSFQQELSLHVQLAFFIPLLNGSGGNAGTQATTVIVRGLATGEITTSLFLSVLWKELRIGFLIGSIMGVLAGGYILLSFGDSRLALTVSLSMLLVVSLAKTIASILPITFKKMNLDPALMSGPLLASVVDIFSIITYLTLASFILS